MHDSKRIATQWEAWRVASFSCIEMPACTRTTVASAGGVYHRCIGPTRGATPTTRNANTRVKNE